MSARKAASATLWISRNGGSRACDAPVAYMEQPSVAIRPRSQATAEYIRSRTDPHARALGQPRNTASASRRSVLSPASPAPVGRPTQSTTAATMSTRDPAFLAPC